MPKKKSKITLILGDKQFKVLSYRPKHLPDMLAYPDPFSVKTGEFKIKKWKYTKEFLDIFKRVENKKIRRKKDLDL